MMKLITWPVFIVGAVTVLLAAVVGVIGLCVCMLAADLKDVCTLRQT